MWDILRLQQYSYTRTRCTTSLPAWQMMLKVVFILWALVPVVGASSSQRKYDGSTLSYDPKGRMFQVEYAMEATRRGGTVLGVCGADCVALVTRDPPQLSSCLSSRAGGVWAVDSHVGIAASGLRSDVQYVVDCARTWCSEHRFVFGGPMPCQMLSRRIADLVHSCTTRGGKRPLAVDVLVGGVDEHAGPSLHRVQATGAFQRYRAVAAGGGGPAANALLAATAPRTATRAAAEEEIQVSRQAGETLSGVPGAGDGGATAVDATQVNKKTGVDGTSAPSGGTGRGDGSASDDEEGGPRDGSGSDGGGRRSRAPTGSGSHGERRWLAHEHGAVLKLALSALWEDSDDNGDDEDDARVGEEELESAATATVASGEERPGLARGGLKASELSAAVYGVKPGLSVGGLEEDVLSGGGCQALEYSMEDFEAALFELEEEKREARKTARKSENAGRVQQR